MVFNDVIYLKEFKGHFINDKNRITVNYIRDFHLFSSRCIFAQC